MKKPQLHLLHAAGVSFLILGTLTATAQAPAAAIEIDASHPLHPLSPYLTGACLEDVNHEVYGGIYSQMLYGEGFQEPPVNGATAQVSGQWRPIVSGNPQGEFALVTDQPPEGRQNQRLTFVGGAGEVGIENEGLNHEGLSFIAGKSYEGCVTVQNPIGTEFFAALESNDGKTIYAETRLITLTNGWQRFDFTLTPTSSDQHGRFALRLKQPGTLTLGEAFLEPGDWGRFHGLPVRRDVVEGLLAQGVKVLRYGGSMVNTSEYRWKKMIGPRDQRPSYHGLWHPFSSNGWGILDFLNLCDAGELLAIPDFNIDESPQDMTDFVEYVNGASDSPWGAKRVADGHPAPYHLTHMELGNEERVDDKYVAKFQALATAIWAKDPEMILVVGDFAYRDPIVDPFHITGADSGISTLAGQQKILQFAAEHHREVWFDVHVWSEGPQPASSLPGAISFRDALAKISSGAQFKVAVFELNSNNHDQKRALGNALAIQTLQRDGGFPVVCSANCLQVDGQNDNGWDQGLLFLNQSQVWCQPHGYVAGMISHNFEPWLVQSGTVGAADALQVDAECADDGGTAAAGKPPALAGPLILKIINASEHPVSTAIHLQGFTVTKPTVAVEQLSGPLDAKNTAEDPRHIAPVLSEWPANFAPGSPDFTFPADSVTIMKIN